MATRITKTQLQDEVEALRHSLELVRAERDSIRAELNDMKAGAAAAAEFFEATHRAIAAKPARAQPCDPRDARDERIELSDERIVTTYWKGDKRYQKVQVGWNRFVHREVRA